MMMIPSLEAMLDGPMNEIGERCPWPYDPLLMTGQPIGQYHCPYCGGMVMAGMPHLDWSEIDLEMPTCRECGNGPLTGPEELLGLCQDCM